MSFLDQLLVAASGQIRVSVLATSGQSVLAQPGQLTICDPTGASVTVSAPSGPQLYTVFGVADATGQAGAHAINVLSSGAAFVLESPSSPGTYSNSVTIASASRVRFWVYLPTIAGGSAGWKIYAGVF